MRTTTCEIYAEEYFVSDGHEAEAVAKLLAISAAQAENYFQR
jgi:hypothetical protein